MPEFDSTGSKRAENFIAHYGRKNMKWHQHRFGPWQSHAQYANGQEDPNKKTTSTSAERRAEKKNRKRKIKEAKKQAKVLLKEQEEKEKEEARIQKEAEERERIRKKVFETNDPVLAYKNRDKFDSKEIQSIITNVNQNNTLRDLAAKEAQRRKGKDFVTKTVDLSKKVNQLYEVYDSNAGKAIRKSVAKSLGLKAPESFADELVKSADVDKILKNYNSLSSKQVDDAIDRLNKRKTLEKIYKESLGPNQIDDLTRSFDIEKIWNNYDKLNAKQLAEAIGRINNKKTLEKMYKEWLKEQGGS